MTRKASGPTDQSSRGSEMARKARTMTGSKWLPAHAVSSARALSVDRAALYDRAAVIVSNASTTAIARPASEIALPCSPAG